MKDVELKFELLDSNELMDLMELINDDIKSGKKEKAYHLGRIGNIKTDSFVVNLNSVYLHWILTYDENFDKEGFKEIAHDGKEKLYIKVAIFNKKPKE